MKMDAVVLKSPGHFVLDRIEKPKCPEDGLLLKVSFCGLCGSDLRILYNGHKNISYPAVIGHEISGRVAETGSLYRGDFKAGDALAVAPTVYCGRCDFCRAGKHEYCESIREIAQHWPGGFAEYVAIPAEALHLGAIQPVPKDMKMELSCIAEPLSSCINAQEKLNVTLEDRVLIIGAGPIGNIHVGVARARGARQVILADISASRLEMSRTFGPDNIIDASQNNLEEEAMRLTDGKGPNVVITANSAAVTQVQAVNITRKSGRIALFGGLPHGDSIISLDTNLVHYKALNIIGTTCFAPRHYFLSIQMIAAGKIPGDLLISDIVPLADFSKTVALAKGGKVMKAVFKLS